MPLREETGWVGKVRIVRPAVPPPFTQRRLWCGANLLERFRFGYSVTFENHQGIACTASIIPDNCTVQIVVGNALKK